jgi:hypothetical protein
MGDPCVSPGLKCTLRISGQCYGTSADLEKCGGERVPPEVPLQQCPFDIAYVGQCKGEGKPYCEKHAGKECVMCGKQATRECSHTGQFVCGFPLCDDCKHPHERG